MEPQETSSKTQGKPQDEPARNLSDEPRTIESSSTKLAHRVVGALEEVTQSLQKGEDGQRHGTDSAAYAPDTLKRLHLLSAQGLRILADELDSEELRELTSKLRAWGIGILDGPLSLDQILVINPSKEAAVSPFSVGFPLLATTLLNMLLSIRYLLVTIGTSKESVLVYLDQIVDSLKASSIQNELRSLENFTAQLESPTSKDVGKSFQACFSALFSSVDALYDTVPAIRTLRHIRASSTFIAQHAVNAPAAEDIWPPMESDENLTTAEFLEKVHELVRDSHMEVFFNRNDDFIQEVTENAVELRNEKSTSLGNTDLLIQTIKVSLYQQVIYCDDSASMKIEPRWEFQKHLVERIAKITTRVLPQGEGVALRFINQRAPNSSNLRLDDIESILERERPDPRGGSRIGTNLRSKILKPLVYDKIDSVPKGLARPLLITILTDGGPEGEPQDTLRTAIVECRRRLDAAQYPHESVIFIICQIGTSNDATRFLKTIRDDTEIADVVHCVPVPLDRMFEMGDKNEAELDRLLIETLCEPLKDWKEKPKYWKEKLKE